MMLLSTLKEKYIRKKYPFVYFVWSFDRYGFYISQFEVAYCSADFRPMFYHNDNNCRLLVSRFSGSLLLACKHSVDFSRPELYQGI